MGEREPTNAELLDAIVQLHGYVDTGLTSLRQEFRQDLSREIGTLQHEIGTLRSDMNREIGMLRHDMNRRFDRVDERFDSLECRVVRMERKVERS